MAEGINKYMPGDSVFYDCKNCHNIPLTRPIQFIFSSRLFYDASLWNGKVSLSEINCQVRELKSLTRLMTFDFCDEAVSRLSTSGIDQGVMASGISTLIVIS
jgi:hypothetical protein